MDMNGAGGDGGAAAQPTLLPVKLEGVENGRAIRPPPEFCNPEDPDCCDPSGDCCDDGNEEDVELNSNGRLKSTCEKCSQAKIKCSGSIPCERCQRKGLECEYRMEKKRGRRTALKIKKELCSDASCWGQIVLNPINKIENFGVRFGLESVERRIFQVFFAMYKHHATPQSCCKGWFSFQLNKMSTFMLRNGNQEGSEKLDTWMSKKGIRLMRRDPADYRKIPANVIDEVSGRILPPIHPMKGPTMTVAEHEHPSKRKRVAKAGSKTYSTRGYYVSDGPATPVDREIERMRSTSCFLNLRATHERFEVEVNDEFVALFGYTTRSIILVLERLFGGLLPWGCDVLALLLSSDRDLLFFMRTLALKMNHLGRPPQFPATRQACSHHVFDFDTKNGDVVECMLTCVHREYLSMDRTEVDIYMGFEPMLPNVPRVFANIKGASSRISSMPGEDTSMYDETKLSSSVSAAPYAQSFNMGSTPLPPSTRSPSVASTGSSAHSHMSTTAVPGGIPVRGTAGYTSGLGQHRPAQQELHTQVEQMALQEQKRPPPEEAPQFRMPTQRPVLAGTEASEPPDNELEGGAFLDNIMSWVDDGDQDTPPPTVPGQDSQFISGNMSLGGQSMFIPGTNSVMSQLSFSDLDAGNGVDFDFPDASTEAMRSQQASARASASACGDGGCGYGPPMPSRTPNADNKDRRSCALDLLPEKPSEAK
ncbi:Xylanolytic transcriptional activator xlnR-like [Hondaea fermentalgiana]|uniref:Xylanolytic transcriptional activator xlnR-like n=1 Tax=Hondaea fermentalgiana TaxID=2315210 RepID=A0A2R5GJ86_9STRA|nr:Xylanolytic transcriptional activator xlnR-like [Hondaea fermentalgiana]|eukprot:GBG27924.1 Xylanolytic transcriptional activator xlnR-like [Hondaea fermentalgiana]